MNVETLILLTSTVEWKNGRVRLIDQTRLPLEEVYIDTDDYRVVCDAIYRLAIRGAPAIGVAGAYACVLAANEIDVTELDKFVQIYLQKVDKIGATRPTAVNLMWAVKQMKEKATSFSGSVDDLKLALLELAHEIREDDIDRCNNLSLHGATLIPDNANVMTICNTGGLATSGIGTALGVIQYAHAQGKDLKVYVCETRPLLQGAKLNTWELKRTETPFTLMTDSMAAQTMNKINIDGILLVLIELPLMGIQLIKLVPIVWLCWQNITVYRFMLQHLYLLLMIYWQLEVLQKPLGLWLRNWVVKLRALRF